ncbi:MAG: hypothetical protein WC866_03190 [Patescibacteria group bacterium]|jgi:hypothetical protein
MQDTSPTLKSNGLDTVIKVLTILKLLLQVAFYGLLLGGTLWFLLKNPLPEIMQGMQDQIISSFMQGNR